jgi:bile acid-coenzyme A ligase
VTQVRGDERLARPGTVGRGFLTKIRILDDAGNLIPPGTTGTVFMRPRSGLPWPWRGRSGRSPARSNAGGWPLLHENGATPP